MYRAGQLKEARQMQLALVQMVRCFVKYPPIPAQRAIMKMLGWDLGPCRLPLTSLSAQDTAALQTALEALGFFRLLDEPVIGSK